MEIGSRISDLRRALGRARGERLTQRELAERIGVSVGTVTAWEIGKQRPDGENLVRLAAALGVTPERIIEGGDRGATSDIREKRPGYETEPGGVAGEAERWLAEVIQPELLRRQSRTPHGRDLILGIKSFVFDLDWPVERKNAVDALLNRIAADATSAP